MLDKTDVLLAAHRVSHAALTEWVGMNKEDASADIQYLWGIHDLAEELLNRCECVEKG